jgi:hypothetical protein
LDRAGTSGFKIQIPNYGICKLLLIINKEGSLQVNAKQDMGILPCHIPRELDKIIIVV